MAPLAIVTAADTNFFGLLQDLVASIREKPQGQSVPIYVLDAGLSEPEHSWLSQHAASAVHVPWPYPLDVSGPLRALAMRSHIPALMPGHEIYLWLDADTWVQDWPAIELYRRFADEREFCVTAETDRSFAFTEATVWLDRTARRLLGPAVAYRLVGKPLLNAGVFAGRADAPHWSAWQKRVQSVLLQTAADFFLDQTALNAVVYVDGLDVAVLPASCNWACHRALPRASDDGSLLLEPQAPYPPLGIVHMTGATKQEEYVLRTASGGMITRSLRYTARPKDIEPPDETLASEIKLALYDSATQWIHRAAQRLRQLVSENPASAEALFALGKVCRRDAAQGEAVRALSRADALRPDNIAVLAELGAAYLQQGRYDEAALTFRRALALSPDDRNLPQHLQEAVKGSAFPPGDYVSPGLLRAKLDRHFPFMVRGDPAANPWRYLRRPPAHNWYVDKRERKTGFVSRDEAHILFNTALNFEGGQALEIGCFMGFSTCHLALGGVRLDVVDPLLRDPGVIDSVTNSLISAGLVDDCRLWPMASPDAVRAIAESENRRWSLVFIDGDHAGEAPRRDAEACEPFLEADALVLFHDLLSPDVAAGLRFFRERGWRTRIYRTNQVMGAAWRGAAEPVEHIPDPALPQELPAHLADWTA